MLNCIINPRSGQITTFFAGEIHTVDKEHINYNAISAAIKEMDEVKLEQLLNCTTFTIMNGAAEIKEDGTILVAGEMAHTTLAKRIMEFAKKGLPFEPLKNFMENCNKNPSPQSIKELYDFLENRGIPITADGHFLAYKAVRADMKDIYSGTIDNSVGNIVEFDWTKVDPDRQNQCSFGLHVGALEYVSGYGSEASRVWLLCKINPCDAVAVPLDHSAQKIRVRKYEVLEVIDRTMNSLKKETCYSPDGHEVLAGELSAVDWNTEEDEIRSEIDLQISILSLEHTKDSAISKALDEGIFATREEAAVLGKDKLCELIAKAYVV